jgi:putative flippase GtrA
MHLSSEFNRYLAVSVFALGVDVFALLSLTQLGLHQAAAAAFAYMLGMVCHYLLAIRFVFTFRRLEMDRAREFLLYATSAFIGLTLSVGIIWLGTQMHLNVLFSKAAAVAVSFVVTFLLRKALLFKPTAPKP